MGTTGGSQNNRLLHIRPILRGLARRRTLSVASVLTLALGIGTGAALLSVFDAAVRAPFRDVPESHRLIDVQATYGGPRAALYPADLLAWRKANPAFAAFGGYKALGSVSWTGDGPPQRLSRFLVTDGYFPAWGVTAQRGRLIEIDDVQPGAPAVAVVSHSFWQSALGGAPDVLGRRLNLDGQSREVVGVLPPGFVARGGEPDLFLPMTLGVAAEQDRDDAHLGAVARLRPGGTLAQAQAELEAISARLAATGAYGSGTPPRPSLVPMGELMRGPTGVFRLLGVAVVALLVLVAIDTAQLQLAVARNRAHEMSIRACLGAPGGRRAARVFAETAVLAVVAIPLGVLIAAMILRLLPNLGGHLTYQALPPELNLRVIAATTATIIVVALIAACPPAWIAARARPDHRSVGADRIGHRGRWLVIAQIAIAFALLTGAGLLIRGTAALLSVDLGYEPSALLKAEVTLPAQRYPTAEAAIDFYPQALDALEAQPGVSNAAAALYAPGGGWTFRPAVDGDDSVPVTSRPPARFVAATPGYVETVGLRQLAGRWLGDRDTAASPPVAVISATAADRLFSVAGEPSEAMGRRLSLEGRWYEVVGVVSDVRRDPLSDPDAILYVSHTQLAHELVAADLRTMVLLVRGPRPENLAPALRDAIARVDPNLPLADVSSLEARVATQLLAPRLQRIVLLVLAIVGLSLGALGLYGLLRTEVRSRQREWGVRLALGAQRADVLTMVLRDGIRLALLGLVTGAILAAIAGRLLTTAFWGIPPHDLPTWLTVAMVVMLVALGATWLPARRAVRVDPMTVLREE